MKKTLSVLVQWYAEAILLLSPLVMTDYYANITGTKSWFYIGLTGVMMLAFLCMWKGSGTTVRMNVPVICACIFVLCSLVSALLSPYGIACFTGADGRNMGVLFLLACAVNLFLLTNLDVKDRFLIGGAFIVEAVIVLIAVLNYVGIDFLGFVSAVPDFAKGRYLSTIGYSNFMSQYVSIITVMEMVCFIQSAEPASVKKTPKRQGKNAYWLLPLLFISYIGLIVSDSATGIFGVAFAVSLFPFLMPKENLLYKMSCILLPLPFSCAVGKLLLRHTVIDGGEVRTDSLIQLITRWPVVLGLFIFITALFLFEFKRINKGSLQKTDSKRVLRGKEDVYRKIYGIAYIALAGVFVVLLILSNSGAVTTPLTITDSFASNRGYIWKESLRLYRELPLKNKLFGIGPDELLPYLKEVLGVEAMAAATGQVFDSAHNFVIHYLITLGCISVFSLIAGLVYGINRIVHKWSANAAVFFLPFACYLVQALVIPSTPIILPIAICCFAVAYRRTMAKENNEPRHGAGK